MVRGDTKGSVPERIAIVTICFGYFIFLSVWSVVAGERSYEYSTAVEVMMLGLEVLFGGVAMLVLRQRGWTRDDFGFRITFESTMSAILLLTPLLLILTTALYRLLAAIGALKGWTDVDIRMNGAPAVVLLVLVVNSFFEEVFVAGYLIEASRQSGTAYAVSLSALVRLLYHTYQGPAALASILPIGIVFGIVYARTRNLWPLIVTHTTLNLISWWLTSR